jgi:hypothetical protein
MLVAYWTAALVFPKRGGRMVVGDATHHFVQLRSIVFDRDLRFRNEYVRLYELSSDDVAGTEWIFTDLTATGRVRNYMPIGPALLWAPLYLAVALVQSVLAAFGVSAPPDGFGWAFQMVPGVTGIAAATVAAVVSFRLARQYTDPASAAVGTLAVWLGSHAIYYSLVSPSYSHAASMLTSALFFTYWLSVRDRPSVGSIASMGALGGLATLMRWQDVVFLAVPLIEAIRWRTRWPLRLVAAGAAVALWAVVFSPQMVVWKILYGQALAVPQGPSFMQWTTPHPVAVLFSTNHGLFTWAPILVLAVLGLVSFGGRYPPTVLPLAGVLLASWYVNAAAADWWAGEAYGARWFLSLFPLFVVGMATWVYGGGRPLAERTTRIAVLAVLVVTNGLLLLQYQLFMKGLAEIAPYPRGFFDMWVARFVVPARLLVWWLR